MCTDFDEQWPDPARDRAVKPLTPHKVLHYSAAATAGFFITEATVSWLMAIARVASNVSLLFLILACASLYAWASSPPGQGRYNLVYLAVCLVVALITALPMLIATHLVYRMAARREGNHNG